MSGCRVMSGAELKVQLTGLGLTPAWLAEQLDITTRTVIRWCALDQVPAKAVAEIDKINAETNLEMNRTYQAMLADGVLRTQRVDHPGHLPAAWHRALTFRVLEHVRNEGLIHVAVAYV